MDWMMLPEGTLDLMDSTMVCYQRGWTYVGQTDRGTRAEGQKLALQLQGLHGLESIHMSTSRVDKNFNTG